MNTKVFGNLAITIRAGAIGSNNGIITLRMLRRDGRGPSGPSCLQRMVGRQHDPLSIKEFAAI